MNDEIIEDIIWDYKIPRNSIHDTDKCNICFKYKKTSNGTPKYGENSCPSSIGWKNTNSIFFNMKKKILNMYEHSCVFCDGMATTINSDLSFIHDCSLALKLSSWVAVCPKHNLEMGKNSARRNLITFNYNKKIGKQYELFMSIHPKMGIPYSILSRSNKKYVINNPYCEVCNEPDIHKLVCNHIYPRRYICNIFKGRQTLINMYCLQNINLQTLCQKCHHNTTIEELIYFPLNKFPICYEDKINRMKHIIRVQERKEATQ